MLYGKWIVLHERREYNCTASGKGFKAKPSVISRDFFTVDQYNNFVDSIPFFNRFGGGAYCRGQKNYTTAGYLYTSITTVNPGRTLKLVDIFHFHYRHDLEVNAGFRERDIVERCINDHGYNNGATWEGQYIPGHGYIITFITGADNEGHADSAAFQENGRLWVN